MRTLVLALLSNIILALSASAAEPNFDFLLGPYEGTWKSGAAYEGISCLSITEVNGNNIKGKVAVLNSPYVSGAPSEFSGIIKKGEGVIYYIEFVKDARVRYTLNIIGERQLNGISEGRTFNTISLNKISSFKNCAL